MRLWYFLSPAGNLHKKTIPKTRDISIFLRYNFFSFSLRCCSYSRSGKRKWKFKLHISYYHFCRIFVGVELNSWLHGKMGWDGDTEPGGRRRETGARVKECRRCGPVWAERSDKQAKRISNWDYYCEKSNIFFTFIISSFLFFASLLGGWFGWCQPDS